MAAQLLTGLQLGGLHAGGGRGAACGLVPGCWFLGGGCDTRQLPQKGKHSWHSFFFLNPVMDKLFDEEHDL